MRTTSVFIVFKIHYIVCSSSYLNIFPSFLRSRPIPLFLEKVKQILFLLFINYAASYQNCFPKTYHLLEEVYPAFLKAPSHKRASIYSVGIGKSVFIPLHSFTGLCSVSPWEVSWTMGYGCFLCFFLKARCRPCTQTWVMDTAFLFLTLWIFTPTVTYKHFRHWRCCKSRGERIWCNIQLWILDSR